MSKSETTKQDKSPRTRRASVLISEAARVELHHVANVFELPLGQVRDAAGELASEAILATLRQRLGAARLEAARAEYERLEREMGWAGGGAKVEPETE